MQPSARLAAKSLSLGMALYLGCAAGQPAWAEDGPGWMTDGTVPTPANTSVPASAPVPEVPPPKLEPAHDKTEPAHEKAEPGTQGPKVEGPKSEGKSEKEEAKEGEAPRRGKPLPLDEVFPLPEFPGPLIGVSGDAPLYPLTKALWDAAPALKDANIRVYGWFEPNFNLSTSSHTNFPQGDNIYSNRLEVNESVLRVERVPNTVQTDHVDYGFRITSLYGIDYRFTTSQGYFSHQLLRSNNLYGYDPVEAYFQVYIPKAADGMLITVGRYISPAELEAPMSPMNFLPSHSLMNLATPATFTGVKAELKLDDSWSLMGQITAGGDVAPWAPSAKLNGGFMVRWVSGDNHDSVWAGINTINGADFNRGHDQLNQFVGTYSHKFSNSINTMTEVYYEFGRNAFLGGTVNTGTAYPWFPFTGQGPFLPGSSADFGVANFLNFKLSGKDYLSLRTDYLDDPRGERTGFPASFGSISLGWGHNFSQLFTIRPEFRYETCFSPGLTPYDSGTKKSQTSFILDAIVHF